MADASAKKTMPKGVRKGGTRFPRHKFTEALPWARKLVSKTHLGPQPVAIVLSGVVGATSSVGEVKISSLRQYGLLEGKAAEITASDLARRIAAAPEDELRGLFRQAVMFPPVFKALFDTFHGDEVPRAKLTQRAAALKVHPDETDTCIDVYIDSMQMAGLVRIEGDRVIHLSAADANGSVLPPLAAQGEELDEKGGQDVDEDSPEEGSPFDPPAASRRPTANVTIAINVDSSLDTDKLEKQLQLLKRYGAL